VTMLQTNLTHSNIDNGEVVLMLNTEKDTLFRLRSPDNFEYLLDWAHAIRRATTYYQSQDGIASLQKKQPVTKAKEKFGLEEVENGACKVLGYASKKGGGVRGFKRRWWVLDSHYLYYFKDDIRKSKKQAAEAGMAQGYVDLMGADITWDSRRTGKSDGCLIVTHKRTFYVVPDKDSKQEFYDAIDALEFKLWDRQPYDFARHNRVNKDSQ